MDKAVIKFYDKEKTVLEQIMDKKILHPYGCLSGSCGACKMKKPLLGEVSEIDEPIFYVDTEKEFLPCICKIKSSSNFISLEFDKEFVK